MKKALCVGIGYQDSTNGYVTRLPKAHEDATRVRDLLINTYGYEDVVLMLDDESGDERPTREGILQAMNNLVEDAADGDRLVFHYSGHGSQVVCQDGNETDGLDEALWPEDVEITEETEDNVIIDNDIHNILVERLPTGVHMTIIFDCCHSGTAADLPEHQRSFKARGAYKVRRPNSGEEPEVVAWSACKDPQKILEFKSLGGLLVYFLCENLSDTPNNITYGTLLQMIKSETDNVYDRVNQTETVETPLADISVMGDYDEALYDTVEV